MSTFLHRTGLLQASAPSTLLEGLAAYWNLDEASGQRNDSHTNALHLTDNNTVGSDTGVGAGQTAADFIAANFEHLSRVDDDALSIGDRDWTAVLWARLSSLASMRILNKGYAGSEPLEYSLILAGGFNRFEFQCRNSADSATVSATDGTSRSVDTWYFAECGYDAVNDQVFISVDRAAQSTAALAGGTNVTTNDFHLSDAAASVIDGRVQAVGIWHRLLTTEEKDKLYNGATAALLYGDL